jgi:hypothetical protein
METKPAKTQSDEKSARKRFKGQTVVEFALVLPVLLLIIFVIIELARLLHAWLAIENGARFGVRYAVTGDFNDVYCSGFPGSVCDDSSEEESARIPSIHDVARAGSVAILRNESVASGQPGYYKVTVCSSKSIGGAQLYQYHDPVQGSHIPAWCEELTSSTPTEDAGGPGDRVSVTVDFEHPLITPFLTQVWPHLHLTAKRDLHLDEYCHADGYRDGHANLYTDEHPLQGAAGSRDHRAAGRRDLHLNPPRASAGLRPG